MTEETFTCVRCDHVFTDDVGCLHYYDDQTDSEVVLCPACTEWWYKHTPMGRRFKALKQEADRRLGL